MNNEKTVFATLNAINVNGHTEKKNGLTYLSWAWAWGEVKKQYPDANYTIYENKDGWNYFTDGRTCWVKTGVTINGLEHIEYLPVMDHRNASIAQERVTSFDVNKAIQRSLTKACARHGLGLYIYAGEDLPEDDKQDTGRKEEKKKALDAAIKKVEQTTITPKALKEDDDVPPWEEPEDQIDEQVVDDIWTTAQMCGLAENQVYGIIKKYYFKEIPEELTTAEANDFIRRAKEYKESRGGKVA